MASEADYEDGEILEEGEEASASDVVPSASHAPVQPPIALLPTPSSTNPRKRLHSSLQDTTVYDTRAPLSHRQPTRYNSNGGNGYSDRRRDTAPHEHDDRVYAEDLVIKYPRQQPRSNDVQKLVLNVLRGGSRKKGGHDEPLFAAVSHAWSSVPTKVCIVLLEKLHPSDELVFTPAGTFTRKSQPLGGTWELDGDLLHLKWRQRTTKAASAVDETPTDQDAVMEEEEDDAYILDVLVSQDGSMHEFRTDPVTDETYAHKVPEHLAKKRRGDGKPRSIWLSLAKAIAVDEQAKNGWSKELQETESSGKDGKEEVPWKREAFEYYLLSLEDLKQHGFPTDVEEEQRKLLEATEGNTRDSYVATQPRPTISVEEAAMETDETLASVSSSGEFIYALDCEMCETDIGMELTRVTVVDIKGDVVYDQLVKPQSTIINYHTEFSGISEETLRDTKYILADVQRDLTTRFLFKDTILVGHSLTSDLRALRLVHPTIGDTAILYPHQRGFPFRTSLKYLTKTYLKKDIQIQTQAGHDSAEDAIASLELLLLKVREGPWFGIPESVSSGGAFDSIVDKAFALEKKMTMLRLQNNGETTEGNASKTSVAERKPWDLHASGDLKAQSQSPFRHAQAVKAKAEASSSTTSVAASANALLKSSEAMQQPDLCWVEIEPPSASTALCNDFVGKHELWMAEQQAYCEQVDAFLQQLRDEVLPKGTLLLALPQGDLSLLRYLKGLRTRSKWRDATPSSDDLAPEELHAAVGDAFRGAMDSCLFLMQK
ncbi:Exonuclease, RNase T/DNA polymerase III [Phytophthora cactorum]|nr:Exonuclease, RNase T/DNA polymerase III [Phytophthora cactorum]